MKLEGAEAILENEKFLNYAALRKIRIEKKYRPKELDEKIRTQRTKGEARLLHKAKKAGVLVPYIFAVGREYIVMDKIDGKTLNKIKKIKNVDLINAAKYLAKMHKVGIIHGDYTPANLMIDKKNKLYVIDFGLGFISNDKEDMAVDVLTMINSIDEGQSKVFLRAYKKFANADVLKIMEKVQKRARYKIREI